MNNSLLLDTCTHVFLKEDWMSNNEEIDEEV